MNAAQLTAFKAAILADSSLAAARTAGDHGAIAAYYQGAGSGTVWRPVVTTAELNTAIVWTEFIALSVQVQNAYIALIQAGSVDATSANVRAGFSAIFTGTSLANLTAIAKRVPTRFEALFSVANVCSVFGQTVAAADIAAALGS